MENRQNMSYYCDLEFLTLSSQADTLKRNRAAMWTLLICELTLVILILYIMLFKLKIKNQTYFTKAVVLCTFISTLISTFELACWIRA